MNPRVRTLLYFLGAIVVTASISVALTIYLMNKQMGDRVIMDTQTYQRYDELTPLLEMIDRIESDHYGEEITRQELIDGALKGMVEGLGDPYARYYSEDEYISFLEQLNGAYHGIGALVSQPSKDGVLVLKVYKESPAEKAGLLSGDIITKVDGNPLSSLTLEETESLFVGKDGTEVSITLLRGEETLNMNVIRGSGTTQRVEYRLFNYYTGYIRLDKFSGTAAAEFEEAILDLTDRGMKSLVVDLRNNPGGDLEQVVSITNLIVGEGVIVSVKQKNGAAEVYRADTKYTAVPLAVLVNENSASASEILAAAVKESGRGLVVGTNTYGKGVVQTTSRLNSNGGWIKITTAAYYTPNGNSVDGKGVQPDIEVDLSPELKSLPIEQIDQDDDAQLWAALDEVRQQVDDAA